MMTEGEVVHLRGVRSDSSMTLEEIDRWLERIESERAEWLDIQAEIAASAPAGPMLNQHQQSIAAAVRDDLLMIPTGIPRGAGISNRRLEERRGQPGLVELDDTALRLKAIRQKLVSHDELWGNVKTLPHRYIGPQHKTWWPSERRYLEPGDVVELREKQAIAFRDRFELVSREQAPDVVSPDLGPVVSP